MRSLTNKTTIIILSLLIVICAIFAIVVEENLNGNYVLKEYTIKSNIASDGTTTAISGILPSRAKVSIENVCFTEDDLTSIFSEEEIPAIKTYAAYDIAILSNGEEWEPIDKVAVSLKDLNFRVNEGEKLVVTHINGKTGDIEKVDAKINENGEVTFNADSFSVYIFTVEFAYDDLVYSIEGMSSVSLSQLFDELNIYKSISNVESVTFSDNDLLEITKLDDDFLITSLHEFTTIESLVVSFKDGTEINIVVTDAIYPNLDGDYAYIDRLEVNYIEDGVGNFDTDDNVIHMKDANGNWQDKDSPGNDASNDNGKVRTHDSIIYSLKYYANVYNEGDTVEKATAFFRFILPLTKEEAVWDLTNMNWLQEATVTETNIGGVPCQVLEGKRLLISGDGASNVFPGWGTLRATVKVLNMHHGDEINPTFTMWLEHNEEGYCSVHGRNEVATLNMDENIITVTCAPKYNIQLDKVSNVNAKGDFDFSEGNGNAFDKTAGTVYGRICAFGITLQIYNDRANKGLMGIEIPTGDISFDLDLSTTYTAGGSTNEVDVTNDYTPLVWGYGANVKNNLDNGGRSLNIYGIANHAVDAAPFNSGGTEVGTTGSAACKNGGDWSATKTGNTLHFTISNYEIDPKCFPNTNASGPYLIDATYYNPTSLGYEGFENVGCFSAGKVYIVVPFYDDEGCHIEEKIPGTGHGTFNIYVSDRNLSSQGVFVSNDNLNQMKQTDDTIQKGAYVGVVEGQFGQYILWSTRNRVAVYDVFNGTEYSSNGLDWQLEGGEIAITWGVRNDEAGERENRLIAAKSLMKFDPDAVTLTGEVKYSNAETSLIRTALFAAKKNGNTWIDDAEMIATQMEDLVYYSSLSELENAGKVCVGVLMEIDPKVEPERVDKQTNTFASAYATIKDGAARQETYMCVAETRAWRLNGYLENPSFVVPSLINNDPDTNPIALLRPTNTTGCKDYSKTVYSEDGNYSYGHINSNQVGDSLLVIGTKATIDCRVVQESENTPGVFEEKDKFDLDYFERVVDYGLYPKLSTTIDTLSGEVNPYLETVTIQDTLPLGLSYISGSAYYGGTYTQSDIEGVQGSVSGGIQMEPEISVDSVSGREILTWVIENVTTTSDMSPIYFSANIGNPNDESKDVHSEERLKNSVSIHSTHDCRSISLFNKNLSEKDIIVVKLNAGSISKIADEKFVEAAANGTIGYTLRYSNISTSTLEAVVVDTLPYDNDAHHSSFTGNYTIEEFKINKDVDDISTWKVYYTTDVAARDTLANEYEKTDIENGASTLENGSIVTWVEAAVDYATGNVPTLKGETPTAIATICSISKEKSFEAHLELKKDLYDGEKFVNLISCDKLITLDSVEVISRSIEGCLWIDKDRSGSREATEIMPSGIKVTLLKKNISDEYEPVQLLGENVTCIPGKIVDVNTGETKDGEPGHYMFTGISEGTYAVKFEKTLLNFSIYQATEKAKPGVSTYFNSDADGYYDTNGKLEYTLIDDIVMKSKNQFNTENLTSIQSSRHNDSGICYKDGEPTIKVQFSGIKTLIGRDLQDQEFSFTIIGEDDGTYETVKNDATGNIIFSEIKYDTPGEYSYIVYEEPTTDPETIIDSKVYSFTVTIVEDINEGYSKTISGDTTTGTDLNFENNILKSGVNGKLSISKTVKGDLGDKTKEFPFLVEFSEPDRYSYTGTKTGTIASGETIYLKDGDYILIDGLPKDTTYKVTETDNAGYTMTATGNEGTIGLSRVSEAVFVNTKSSVPDTGDSNDMETWVGLMGICFIGVLITLLIGEITKSK